MSLLAPAAFTSSKPAQQMSGWTEVITRGVPVFSYSAPDVKNQSYPCLPVRNGKLKIMKLAAMIWIRNVLIPLLT
jgi:hypothetical protein